MISAPLTQHPLSTRLTQPVTAMSVNDVDLNDLRCRGDRLLSDLAFVLHLTRKVKRQIQEEQVEITEEDNALAAVGDSGF